MQKKEIKGRRPNNKKVTTKKSTNTKNIKKRIVTNPKEDNKINITNIIYCNSIIKLFHFRNILCSINRIWYRNHCWSCQITR